MRLLCPRHKFLAWVHRVMVNQFITNVRERGLMAAYRLVHKIWEPSSSK